MAVLAVWLLACSFGTTVAASTAAATTATSYRPPAEGPTVDGLETLWVNVSRMVRGKIRPPTVKGLQSIIESYRTGGWWARGAPVKGADGLWWQKLVRTKYIPVAPFIIIPPGILDGCQNPQSGLPCNQ